MQRKAGLARSSAIGELIDAGFEPEVIARAVEIAFTDPDDDYDQMRGVMALLDAAESNVGIEVLSYTEAPPPKPKRSDKRKAFEAGQEARHHGLPCRAPYPAGVLSEEWIKGWRNVK